jgi:hypothetical protein
MDYVMSKSLTTQYSLLISVKLFKFVLNSLHLLKKYC